MGAWIVLIGVCTRGPGPHRVTGIIGLLHSKTLVICPASAICTVKYSTLGMQTIRGLYRLGKISPQGGGLSVMYRSLSGVDRCTLISGAIFGLLHGGLPKPFAFVLPTDDHLPGVFGGGGRINVHVPSRGITQKLMARLKGPVLSVSIRSRSRLIRCAASPRLVRRGCKGSITVIVSKKCKKARPSAIMGYVSNSFRVIQRKGNGLVR